MLFVCEANGPGIIEPPLAYGVFKAELEMPAQGIMSVFTNATAFPFVTECGAITTIQ